MSSKTLRIATRKSPLALWQANYVKAALELAHSDLHVELLAMSTEVTRFWIRHWPRSAAKACS